MDWIATAFLLYGTHRATTTPDATAFLSRALGDALWVGYGLMTDQWSIVVCEFAFMLIDLKGARR